MKLNEFPHLRQVAAEVVVDTAAVEVVVTDTANRSFSPTTNSSTSLNTD